MGVEGSNNVQGNFYLFQTLPTFSADGISPINETAYRVRPKVTEGSNVNVDVYIMVRDD